MSQENGVAEEAIAIKRNGNTRIAMCYFLHPRFSPYCANFGLSRSVRLFSFVAPKRPQILNQFLTGPV